MRIFPFLMCFVIIIASTLTKGVAQPSDMPLVAHANVPQNFVPTGWVVWRILKGDLNADGIADAVVVMEKGPDSDAFRLAVVLANPTGGFDLASENTKLLSSPHEEGYVTNLVPDGFKIRRGTFTVRISREGPGGMATLTFTFRRQGSQFALIGYDYRGEHVGWGQVSFNMLTGQVVSVDGPVEAGGGHTVESRKVGKFVPPPSVDLEGIGYSFDFEKKFNSNRCARGGNC